MHQPLVSIIVPCYNYAHYLGQTLENVRTQEYAGWECLIVDDGSTDETDKVAASFVDKDTRFRYIHQHNKGLSGARNTGIAHAEGDYIQFLDSDDLIHPSKLLKQVAILEAGEDIDLTYGKSFFFHTSDPGKFYPSRHLTDAPPSRGLQISGRGREILK